MGIIANPTKPITDVRGRTGTFTQGVSSPVAVFQEMKSPAIAVRTRVGETVSAGSVLTIDNVGNIVNAKSIDIRKIIGVSAEPGTSTLPVDIITTGEVFILVDGAIAKGGLITMIGSPSPGVAAPGTINPFAISREEYLGGTNLVSAFFLK